MMATTGTTIDLERRMLGEGGDGWAGPVGGESSASRWEWTVLGDLSASRATSPLPASRLERHRGVAPAGRGGAVADRQRRRPQVRVLRKPVRFRAAHGDGAARRRR